MTPEDFWRLQSMRMKIILLARVLILSIIVAPFSAFSQSTPKPEKPNAGAPAEGLFRVVINGFKVNHESDDDILEGDGKRDEVYLRADTWVLNRNRTVPYHRTPRSRLMGDINNQGNPPRIRAGTGSDDGGLRTNDTFPTPEPWLRVRAPLTDRLPMLLWEGVLRRGENMAVIIPTIWEWDSRDPSESEIAWENGTDPQWRIYVGAEGVNAVFDAQKWTFAQSIETHSTGAILSDSSFTLILGSIAGTRPIGIERPPNLVGRGGESRSMIRIRPAVFTLTYDAALRATINSPANVGLGVFALNYVDQSDHGDYTLYVQIEQIK